MFKQAFLLIMVIFLNHFSSFSQTKYIYYFDKNINPVEKASKAVFNGVGIFEHNALELKITDAKTNKLLILQHFTDPSLDVSNGLFVSYFHNGAKEWEGNYLMSKRVGVWRKWLPNGRLTDSSYFFEGANMYQYHFSYYPDGKLMEKQTDSAGTRTIVLFDPEGNVMKPIAEKADSDTEKVFVRTEVDSHFPGGPAAFSKYISRTLSRYMDDFTNEDNGTVMIKFVINRDGTVSDVSAMNMKGTKLANVGIEAIKSGPHWFPAKQNGRSVRSYKIQPISLEINK